MVPVTKPQSIRELGAVDIAVVKDLVARMSESVWDQQDAHKENKFECFHHTRHIIFRFIKGMRDHRRFYSNPIWSVWQDHLLPVMDRAIAPYGFREPTYPKVMLARLAAGEAIDRHVDGGGSNLFTHKIHVPIQSSEQALMLINDQSFHLMEGYAYEVNNLAPHGVENHGSVDRIHLIFEVFDQAERVSS
jgi:hypothetical protein